jgi:periplasmic divalent cation tolerance protein
MSTLHPSGASQPPAYCVVLTTVSTAQQAGELARQIIEARLGACVQIETIRSIYRWQGAVCDEPEHRLSIKTQQAKFAALDQFIRARHSYETPELVQIPITAGSAGYLQWLDDELKDETEHDIQAKPPAPDLR